MNIRTKMISLLALLFAVLIALEITVQKQVLMPSFAELERADAETSMTRIGYALDMTLDGVELSASDWGNWADVYHYVQSPGAEFVNANITAVGMKQLKVNAMLHRRFTRQLRRCQAPGHWIRASLSTSTWPSSRHCRRTFPGAELRHGQGSQRLAAYQSGRDDAAAAPVLDGSGAGEPLGMVVMGRLLTPREVFMIGRQAQASLTMLAERPASGGARVAETGTSTQVTKSFSDIYGTPLMSFAWMYRGGSRNAATPPSPMPRST